MATFKDTQAEAWEINLDGPTIKEVREQFKGLDLADPEAKFVHELWHDAVTLVDLTWFLCREQAAKRQIGEVDFAKRLRGDVLDEAAEAILEAYLAFSRRLTREVNKASAEKQVELQRLAAEQALQRINNPELTKQLLEAMADRQEEDIRQVLTQLRSATNTPDLLAYTPKD